MYFKPRLFISSTLKLITIRNQIDKFFTDVGAEVMLYEKNLTPSINTATYRRDILDADFVIFILDEYYGTKTDTGKSGTHEEWEIVLGTTIPKHVYVKRSIDSEEQKTFIEEQINGRFVSYYFYKDVKDLFAQLKKTTFTIARAISLSMIEEEKLIEKTIRKFAVNQDYEKSLQFIRGIEEIKKYERVSLFDFIRTDILSSFISPWEEYKLSELTLFIDNKLNDLFDDMLFKFEKFAEIHRVEFTSHSHITITLKSVEMEIMIAYLRGGGSTKYEELNRLLKDFFASYDGFKKYVTNLKSSYDFRY